MSAELIRYRLGWHSYNYAHSGNPQQFRTLQVYPYIDRVCISNIFEESAVSLLSLIAP
jgi:hypothetical protein